MVIQSNSIMKREYVELLFEIRTLVLKVTELVTKS